MRPLLIALTLLVATTCFLSPLSAAPLDKRGTGSQSWLPNIWSPFKSKKASPRQPSRSQEPAFIKSTRRTLDSAWQGTKRTTKSAWDTTVYLLRPYDKDPQPRRSATTARRDADAGFWSNLFGKQEKQEPMTVNEFLQQPTMY